jgi:hypothetical protein
MIVTGRYMQTGPLTVTLSGKAFNQPVSYQYTFNRVDTTATGYQFLTKIWARQKIDNLLVQYYSLSPGSPQALALKQQIINISIAYGVISPFTSFGNPTHVNNETENINIAGSYKLLGNYPNPFNPTTTIKFIVNKNISGVYYIKIYNQIGQLIDVIQFNVNGKGIYEAKWNAIKYSSGIYYYRVELEGETLIGKMMLVK